MIVLGIETSCDETSAAIVKDRDLLCNIVYTQEIHGKYGGVVPEIASREHDVHIQTVVEAALDKTQTDLSDLDAIAVTYGPGLMGTLLVGLNYAKGLAIGLKIPFIGVNHLEGHLFANLIDNPEFTYPFLSLLVSGGHTQIWQVNRFGDYQRLSNTRDDAAGEAFDKGARILGLGYPGGPEIEKNSKNGNPDKYPFTIPKIKAAELDFSFSGLKTAILYTCQAMDKQRIKNELPHLCASYQEVIIKTLLDRIKKTVSATGIMSVAIAGGVAANQRFRKKVRDYSSVSRVKTYFPKMEFCTDNAAMIAIAGFERLRNGETSQLDQKPVPNLSLGDTLYV